MPSKQEKGRIQYLIQPLVTLLRASGALCKSYKVLKKAVSKKTAAKFPLLNVPVTSLLRWAGAQNLNSALPQEHWTRTWGKAASSQQVSFTHYTRGLNRIRRCNTFLLCCSFHTWRRKSKLWANKMTAKSCMVNVMYIVLQQSLCAPQTSQTSL